MVNMIRVMNLKIMTVMIIAAGAAAGMMIMTTVVVMVQMMVRLGVDESSCPFHARSHTFTLDTGKILYRCNYLRRLLALVGI